MIKKLLPLLLLPFSLTATSSVVNKYLPTHTMPELPHRVAARPAVSLTMSAAHAAKSFGEEMTNQYLHQFDGLLEIGGRYDLQNIINAAQEAVTGYAAPFVRETGGDAWINQALEFAAKSSLSVYGMHLGMQMPLGGAGWSVGVQLPFYHLEARQRYTYPITANSQTISLPDQEQVRRLRQYVHKDLGLQPGDWVKDTLGDVGGWVQWARQWSYVWLLRKILLGARLNMSVPTGAYASTDYPSAVPVGGDGHWAAALSIMPGCELKEGLFVQVPCTATLQAPQTRNRRLPTGFEAAPFSPLVAKTRVQPGVTLRIAPQVTVEHLVENVHFSLAYVRTRHYADTWTDKRAETTTPSYLNRTTLQKPITGMSNVVVQAVLAQNVADKKARTSWDTSYVSFDVEYEMKDLFSRVKNAPLLRLTFDYCMSGDRAARTHQISGQISWRF